jgi:hypothetical protein
MRAMTSFKPTDFANSMRQVTTSPPEAHAPMRANQHESDVGRFPTSDLAQIADTDETLVSTAPNGPICGCSRIHIGTEKIDGGKGFGPRCIRLRIPKLHHLRVVPRPEQQSPIAR